MIQITPINLIPAPRILRKRVRSRLRWWTAGLAGYLAVLLFGIAIHRSGQEPIALPDAAAQQERLTQLSAELATAQKELAEARTRRAAVLMLTGRPDWSMLLPLLGQGMGDEVVLKELKLVQARTAGPRQFSLEMRGVARNAAAASNFVTVLEGTHLFDDVRLLRTGREPFLAESMVSFDIQCRMSDAPRAVAAGGVK